MIWLLDRGNHERTHGTLVCVTVLPQCSHIFHGCCYIIHEIDSPRIRVPPVSQIYGRESCTLTFFLFVRGGESFLSRGPWAAVQLSINQKEKRRWRKILHEVGVRANLPRRFVIKEVLKNLNSCRTCSLSFVWRDWIYWLTLCSAFSTASWTLTALFD